MSEENTWSVYRHENTVNRKIYFGITSQIPKRRWAKGTGYRNQPYFYRAIEKYGWDKFEHKVLFQGLSEKEAKQIEIELIAQYDSTNPLIGYNLSIGGEGGSGLVGENACHFGKRHSAETKEKISRVLSGRKYTEEQKARRKGLMKGDLNPFYGRHHSDEAKKRMSEAHKGKQISYVRSAETREKISKIHKGKKLPIAVIIKIVESRQNSVVQLSLQNKQIDIYPSIKIASERTGINVSTIGKCCRHDSHHFTAGGYRWEFSDKCNKSLQDRQKISYNIICITTNQIFFSQSSAAKILSINQSNISATCRGIRNYCGKLSDGTPLRWMYLEDFMKQNGYTDISEIPNVKIVDSTTLPWRSPHEQ